MTKRFPLAKRPASTPTPPEKTAQIKARKSTLERLHALKAAAGFDSLDALLRHLGRVAQDHPELLKRGRA